jgi:nitrogen fixation protein FixH
MADMGWQLEIGMPILSEGKPDIVKVMITDKENRPLNVDTAILYYYRPSDRNLDGEQALASTGVMGEYSAELVLNTKGKWDIIMEVTKGESMYNMGRSIMVQDPQ